MTNIYGPPSTPSTEPIFTLRAQDKLAPFIVRIWAVMARVSGVQEFKIQSALRTADAMESWGIRKTPD